MIDYEGLSQKESLYDVLVVGGGTAGWIAALAAARQKWNRKSWIQGNFRSSS